ncbi:PLP-dependent aminotransferase family protein [Stackebrandtia nassauensis]|uniref:Putative transcriptional regulator, GntR family n=1 Tax=Stackebrandtia nassauensis (strain DSM 44728 / CIP 108903 / NRRL B-16338 / NBRC 102104 / LLR-40K-21) TaxID=446470 RepID=D3Q5I3_STANL|nr:PLP-dependent aminotransferase family protein [Stackebrandtia nassauensis]ADD46043.1 putative transcriptional regulator, GntR family [Stackebrandtia nassauensis DSM 44728]
MSTKTTQDDYSDRYAARVHGMAQSEIRALFSVASRPEVVSLAGGNPFTAALDMDELGEMFARLLAEDGAKSLLYCPGQGDVALREQICEVMALTGIDVTAGASPDDVVVTVGAQQGLDLLCRVFLDPGDVVLAEGPTYVGALGVFQAAQARVRHVAMDDEGLIPAALETAIAEAPTRPKFLYTVPTYQNPTGVTLSESRRQEVLEICDRHGLLIVEDDPYGMLSFDGNTATPLRARRSENVFYVGTFSKIFAAGLRVGWVLAPPAVRDKLVMASEAAVLCPSTFTQAAATRYLTTMPWQQQVKTFSTLYCERRDTMLAAMSDHFPAAMTWTHPGGGLFVWANLPEGLDSKAMLPQALAARVAYVPGTGFYADGSGAGQMRLNFSFPPGDEIREGIRRLSGVINSAARLRDTFTT